MAVKTRSEDVVSDPDDVVRDVKDELRSGYEILETRSLEPFHEDHFGVVATRR